jgi:hypothetical protein
VPEVEDAVRAVGHEPRPEDDVGPSVEQGLQEDLPVVGVVLEVGVLHDDEVGGGLGEPAPQGRPLAPVGGLPQQADPVVVLGHGLDRRNGRIGRAVVDDDHLGGEGRVEHTLEHGGDGLRLVEAGNDDGQALGGQRCSRRLGAGLPVRT